MEDVYKIGYIIASNKVGIERKEVKWMYREEPDDEYDSGWRVFSGEEDQEYTDNPENFKIYSAESILAIDKSIIELLLELVGTEFERDINMRWNKIE